MSKNQKILVCGDVEGNFKTLFSRVNAINEKNGPFDFLFCIGDFFSDSARKLEPYRNGSLNVSVPTYILGPNKAEHVRFYEDLSGCEICPNVNFLGKHGILSSNGLTVGYVSGVEGKKSEFAFTQNDAATVRDAAFKKKLGPRFLGIDVLLTSEWPKNVENFDHTRASPATSEEGSQALAWLACQVKPRYHFSGLRNVFYERPPYRNCSSLEDERFDTAHCTRFIGLAKVGNVGKNKWLYAVNVTPLSDLKDVDLYQATTNETKCPYSSLRRKNDSASSVQFFYDVDAAIAEAGEAPRKRRKRNRSESSNNKKSFDDSETCWFCLASSTVEKHLIISIGEKVYVALARGGLTPYHVMIVPIEHHRAQTELSKSAIEEVKKYKHALQNFLRSKNLVPVIFERNFKTSHLQLHVVPVPSDTESRLKDLFLSFSDNLGLRLSELPHKANLKDFTQPGSPYFYVELPTKEKLFCCCQKNFPIHFGRDVLSSKSVLNLPEKVNWRECIQSKEEEVRLSQAFRKEFENFDDVSS